MAKNTRRKLAAILAADVAGYSRLMGDDEEAMLRALTLVHVTSFGDGLRIVDIADPSNPDEDGRFIPEPVSGQRSPRSNDVGVDERGLICLVDRNVGFDVLEFDRAAAARA